MRETRLGGARPPQPLTTRSRSARMTPLAVTAATVRHKRSASLLLRATRRGGGVGSIGGISGSGGHHIIREPQTQKL